MFDDIKVDNLPEKTKVNLLKIQKATKDFKIEVPKAKKYVQAVYDKIVKEKPRLLISSNELKPLNRNAYGRMMLDKYNLEREKERIEQELKEIEFKLKIAKGAFDPHITITEVNTPSMGHRYIGKFRVYFEGKPRLMTISIGKYSDFKGIHDKELRRKAKEKAKAAVKVKFPEWF